METGFTSQVATTDFLTLLAVQLQHQDPIDPVNQENFVQQLSQFSMLEGVENLNGSFEDMLRLQEISQGVNLVGQRVEYADPFSGEQSAGRIDQMFVDSGRINFLIGDRSITIDQIVGVTAETNTA